MAEKHRTGIFLTRITGFVLLFFIIFTTSLYGGDLDDFERNMKKEESDDRDRSRNSGNSDSSSSAFGEVYGLLLYYTFFFIGKMSIVGGATSLVKMNPDEKFMVFDEYEYFYNIKSRELGESVVPYLRTDAYYQFIHEDLFGIHGTAEVGYGPVALKYRSLNFMETDPEDMLMFHSIQGAYRMTFGNSVTLDLGVGAVIMQGNETRSGLSISLPFRIYISNIMGMELNSEWWFFDGENILSVYDVALTTNFRFAGVRTGYMWLLGSSPELNGFTLGVTFKL